MSGADALLALSPAALQGAMDRGAPVRAAALAGAWYRGTSLGLWPWVERLSWKTFAKVFFQECEVVRGWNVRLHQDGLDAPPRPRTRRDVPVVFGHYVAVDAPDGLVLDYGLGANPRLDPTRLVRDPLVTLTPDAHVLLGRTWLALGARRVPTPSFFLLERAGAIPENVIRAAAPSPDLRLPDRGSGS